MKIRYYISGHGLGHASRSCQIINALRRRHPGIAVEVVSSAHPWFFAGFLDPSVWRSRVGWVPQRPHLFYGSVADNIRLARPEAGFVLQGEPFPSPPPSVVSTLSTDPSRSINVSRTMLSTVADYELEPVSGVVAGAKALSLTVEQ